MISIVKTEQTIRTYETICFVKCTDINTLEQSNLIRVDAVFQFQKMASSEQKSVFALSLIQNTPLYNGMKLDPRQFSKRRQKKKISQSL